MTVAIMFAIKKSYVVIAGILGGLAIAFQNYTITGWQHLKVQAVSKPSVSEETNPTHDTRNPGMGGSMQSPWEIGGGASSNLQGLTSNSSLGEHLRLHEGGNANPRLANAATFVSSNHAAMRARDHQTSPTIRIATFNMQGFGETKLKKAAVMETIARMIRQFDVVALQHIQSRQQNILPELVDRLNMSDRRYDYCIGPRVGSHGNEQQFAFVFDTDRIETDRQQLYTVEDPQDLMEFDPLVGWFRTRSVGAENAFTFSLVNLRIDPINSARELKMLPALIRSVRQDGRSEDDIVLLGDFGCSDRELTSLQSAGMLFAIEGTPTTVTGESMLDNIVFPARATDEFTGKAGVIDFLRQLNLSIDQAFQISSHMPVWAEFFATEGGSPGYIGSRTAP